MWTGFTPLSEPPSGSDQTRSGLGITLRLEGAARAAIEDAGGGEPDVRAGPPAAFALERQAATMQLDEAVAQGESQARALGTAVQLDAHLREALQGTADLLAAHADATVLDLQEDPQLGAYFQPQADFSPRGRELDGIGQEIEQDLLHPPPIGKDQGRPSGQLGMEVDARLLRMLAHQMEAIGGKLDE